MWRLYSMSSVYGQRPSEILGIEDEWLAWQLDETCLMVGREIENEAAEGKNGASTAFAKGAHSAQRGRRTESFAPMASGVVPKMKVPENGIW